MNSQAIGALVESICDVSPRAGSCSDGHPDSVRLCFFIYLRETGEVGQDSCRARAKEGGIWGRRGSEWAENVVSLFACDVSFCLVHLMREAHNSNAARARDQRNEKHISRYVINGLELFLWSIVVPPCPTYQYVLLDTAVRNNYR